ncbi:MAG: hypothetical protein WCX65_01010 [bacterium]
MKKILLGMAMVLVAMFATANIAKSQASVDLQVIISTLAYNYENAKFLGDFNGTFYGVEGGKIVAAIENGKGEKVFEQAYPCIKIEYSDNGPACYIDTSIEKVIPKPLEMRDGAYTLKFLFNGKEVYSLGYTAKTLVKNGMKGVFINGDWKKMALMQFSSEPGIRAVIMLGGNGECNDSGYDAQAQLYKDGVFLARAHNEGLFYDSCSATSISMMLFSEDENHLTKWLRADDVLKNDGFYELKYFVNKELSETYAFKVTAEEIIVVPTAGLQPGLMPERLRPYSIDTWIYEK